MEGSVQNYKQVFHYRLLSQRKVKVFFSIPLPYNANQCHLLNLGLLIRGLVQYIWTRLFINHSGDDSN